MSQDKVVVVAGVGPGNGTALARRFAESGRRVAMLARNKERVEALAASIAGARGFECDVSDASSVEACFAAVAREFGEVDTLLYNAGTGVFADVESITVEQFEQAWRVNAFGSLLCAREVIPAMKAKGAGDIVFIGATASRRGGKMTAAFAPAKAAQRAREGRTIVFIDESGVSERPRRVRTFAPKGKTPVRQESFPWNQLSAIAGVTFWNISFKLVKGGVRPPSFGKFRSVAFRKNLRRHLAPRKLRIIWDCGHTHRSRVVRDDAASEGGQHKAQIPAALLSLIKSELPRAGELAYDVKNIAARGLCYPASLHRSASGKKGA